MIRVLGCIGIILLATSALALPPQSNHGVLKVVPAPGAVVVDGKLEEWDTSGEMFVFGVRKIRERYSVRVHAMWDDRAFYLGMRFRDPSPLINNVDADGAPGNGWMADSFQGRFVTDYSQVHLTAWYSSKKDKSVAQINYHSALDTNGQRVFRGEGKVLKDASGFEQAFLLDADQRGYSQEMRIPWSLLFKAPAPKAGLTFGFTGEYFWGGPSGTTWPAVMWSDPINPMNPVRIVIYQNPGVWGRCELLATGNLPRESQEETDSLLQGPIPIRVTVPSDATKFSLVIEDAEGRRVRNLASHANVSDYIAGALRDPKSASRSDAATRTIEVPWDGRADGEWNKDRMLFLGDVVGNGNYTVRGIAHAGVGVTHAGSFYNPGTPPWPTADGSGAWGFDHTAPQAVAAMPRDAKTKGRVFLGWHHGECGTGFIGLNADGRKIWEWLRRGTGATHIATSSQHVFFCFDGDNGRPSLGKVNPDNGEQLKFGNGSLDVSLPEKPTGLAVRGSHVLVSIGSQNKVLWLNAESAAVQHEFPVTQAGSVTFVSDDQFVVAAGDQLVAGGLKDRSVTKFSFNVTGKVALTPRTPLAFSERLFFGDAASSTVRVLTSADKNGQVVATIGEPGGHRPGPWSSQRMNSPRAIAVEERADGTSLVWVVEESHSPRRVSVWSPDGRFVRDYIGNTRYSASGGFLSDDEPNVGFVDGVRFRIDAAKSDYQPIDVLGGVPAPAPGKQTPFHLGKGAGNFANPYHFFSSVSGTEREYIVEAGGTHPMVFMKRGDRWQCVAALGPASHAAGVPKPAPNANSVFSWNDLDNDGYPTDSEITWHDAGRPHVLAGGWGYRCGRDLTWYHSGLAFRPVKFTPEGAPLYDVSKAERLPGELGNAKGDIHKTRFGYFGGISSGRDVDKHNVIHGLHQLAGFDESGRLRWTYPNYWIAVHGAFTAPMAMPGVLMGTLKTSGVISPHVAGSLRDPESASRSDAATAHDIISLRGNIGQEFLIRDDGLYIGELFTDQRMAPATLPPDENILGLPINDTSLGGEPFNGWIGRQRDGKVRMTYGHTDVRIAEVVGLDRLHPIAPQTVTIGADQIALAKSFVPKSGGVERKTTFDIVRGEAFPLDGTDKLLAAPSAIVIRAGREELGRALLRYDDRHLHLAVQVADITPLQNKGQSPALAFKTGDSVNLFVAEKPTDAGTRLLLTNLADKPTAVLYRPRGPGNQPFVFESPVRKSPFQHVAVDPNVRLELRRNTTDYLLTASIPWSTLALTPQPGRTLIADLGLLFSDDTGATTVQRVHWIDPETNVVNDTPTEAEFNPSRWGTWLLK